MVGRSRRCSGLPILVAAADLHVSSAVVVVEVVVVVGASLHAVADVAVAYRLALATACNMTLNNMTYNRALATACNMISTI